MTWSELWVEFWHSQNLCVNFDLAIYSRDHVIRRFGVQLRLSYVKKTQMLMLYKCKGCFLYKIKIILCIHAFITHMECDQKLKIENRSLLLIQ